MTNRGCLKYVLIVVVSVLFVHIATILAGTDKLEESLACSRRLKSFAEISGTMKTVMISSWTK